MALDAASSSSDSEFGEPTWEYQGSGTPGGLDLALVGLGVAAVGWLGRRLSRRGDEEEPVDQREREELVITAKEDEFQDARETWAQSGCNEDLQSFATMRIELNQDATSESASSEADSTEASLSPVSSPGAQRCTRDITLKSLEFESSQKKNFSLATDALKMARKETGISLANILTGTAFTGWCCCVGK